MRHPFPLTLLAAATLALTSLTGCLPPTICCAPYTAEPTMFAQLDYAPKAPVAKTEFITFTLAGSTPDGKTPELAWSSTKGTLSAKTGQTVAWTPARADGTFEPGAAEVVVTASDGRKTLTAVVDIRIDAAGNATVQSTRLVDPSQPTAATPAPAATPDPALAPALAAGLAGRWSFYLEGGCSTADCRTGDFTAGASMGTIEIRPDGTYVWEDGGKRREGMLRPQRPNTAVWDDPNKAYFLVTNANGTDYLISWEQGTGKVGLHYDMGLALAPGVAK